ncbi:putative transporter [Sphingobium sp. SYK-6]|uniref:nicotinamide riboside transporter PnuC n=1 Tax=Sphingobium sp. (strain NBRC 103272 / SYK-6) TaxID=627192 RepID=UPI00022778EF|nr:nicotinamide riboside transporter PnuC [Sphingobium sp. SYK-6]BAK68034.1 putative transporter [Sphingobium sp. SYK-6]
MSFLEILAVGLGLTNIILIVRRSLWNYPAGIAMVTLYFFIFAQARLYSDALLQIFFLVLNAYGWVNWRRAQSGGDVPVRWLGGRGLAVWGAIALAASLLWGLLMHRQTDAAFPYWDAAVAMLSVTAQLLMARRYIDNWAFWILVDCLAIPLYWMRGLHLTAGLYVVFLALSIAGLIAWTRARRAAA